MTISPAPLLADPIVELALARAAAASTRLDLGVGPIPLNGFDGDSVACTEVIDPTTGMLDQMVSAHSSERSIAVRNDAALLLLQRYAHRATGPAVAVWALTGLTLDLSAPRTWVEVVDASPSRLGTDAVSVLGHDPDGSQLLEVIVDGHLVPFMTALRESSKLAWPGMWGNVTASIAGVFTMLSAAGVPASALLERAAMLLGQRPELAAGGAFRVIGNGATERLFFERTTCCGWYRIPAGNYCTWCSLKSPEERNESFLAQM